MLDSIIDKLKIKTKKVHKLGGGDISTVYRLEGEGQDYVLKINSKSIAQRMFETEALGLGLLGKSGCIPVPNVKDFGKVKSGAYILIEYIPTSRYGNSNTMKAFGRNLAKLHQERSLEFGLSEDNFIGSLDQSNKVNTNWVEFYWSERLEAQISLAITNNRLTKDEVPEREHALKELNNLIPKVKPSLLHGDLWSGNYLVSEGGDVYIIDPAVYYGHSEVDIAMSKLFGGFSSEFYDSYFEILPKESGFEARMDIYQLYYLLVHLNLFGSSYYGSVKRILSRYFL